MSVLSGEDQTLLNALDLNSAINQCSSKRDVIFLEYIMKKILTLLGGMLVSVNAYSANPTCAGKISGVSISTSGGVYASIKSGTTTNLLDVQFCELNSTEGDYSGESCKGILSLLMAGEAMDKTAILWFKAESFASCSQSWKSLKDFGLYYFKVN